jgi:hypothetical protein
MTNEELALQLSKYILEHWDAIVIGTISVAGSLIFGTWMAAKYWYQREIKHVTDVGSANEQLANKQIAHMTKQLEHKESYARGVIEIMNQRVLAAEEEPKRLLRIIQQQEQHLARLQAKSQEEAKEIQELPEVKARSVFISYSFSNKSNIDEILRDIFDRDPDDSGISIVKNEYRQIKEEVWEKSSNLSAMVGLMGLLLRLQNEKIVSLNMSVDRCHVESSISYVNFYKSIKKIISPVAGDADKDYFKIVKEALDNRDKVKLFSIEKKRNNPPREEDSDKNT